MIPLKLSLKNFMCYGDAELDFSQFSSALIIGKIDGNELYSNNVGKTTIFKSIEYVLFNKTSSNLDTLIRDGENDCKVSFEFCADDGSIYVVERMRTRKGTNDLSLFKDGNVISGRRVQDTEKMLLDLIKINYSSFRTTIHFVQNDYSGLGTVTPEKRKALLKEALQLTAYSKLEKLAKDKLSALQKDLIKQKAVLDTLGEPQNQIKDLDQKINNTSILLQDKNSSLIEFTNIDKSFHEQITTNESSISEKKKELDFLLEKEKSLVKEIASLEFSKKQLLSDRDSLLKESKSIANSLKELNSKKEQLILLDIDSNIEKIAEEMNSVAMLLQEKKARYDIALSKIKELEMPLPQDNYCKHCRQELSDEHRKICQDNISKEIDALKYFQESLNKDMFDHKEKLKASQLLIDNFHKSKKILSVTEQQIKDYAKDLDNKKQLYETYKDLLAKGDSQLAIKQEELSSIKSNIENASEISKFLKEISDLKIKRESNKKLLEECANQKLSFEKEFAVLSSNLEIAKSNLKKLNVLNKEITKLNDEIYYYPDVIEAFGSSGIINLIIQNILDDLQLEANALLNQLKPGLQLSFVVEKTKGDGSQDDTLDIMYYVNGKEREFEQIGGAYKIAIHFALKIGLFNILQRLLGTNIRLLLLDEIDQPLDKAGIDALSDMIKVFQKDFSILVITHNDRLKDKFQHYVVVEQDKNMISKIIQYVS